MNILTLISIKLFISLKLKSTNCITILDYSNNKLEATSIDKNCQCYLSKLNLRNNRIKLKINCLFVKRDKLELTKNIKCLKILNNLNRFKRIRKKRKKKKKLYLHIIFYCLGNFNTNIIINKLIIHFNIHNKHIYNILTLENCLVDKDNNNFIYKNYKNELSNNLNIYLNELILIDSTIIPCGINYSINVLIIIINENSNIKDVGEFSNNKCQGYLNYTIFHIRKLIIMDYASKNRYLII